MAYRTQWIFEIVRNNLKCRNQDMLTRRFAGGSLKKKTSMVGVEL